MSEPLSLFLACSFAQDKALADGSLNQSCSDWDLAQIVRETIEAESCGRIQVVITKDPFDEYIPSKVREELAAADLMLCLFTRRTPIPHSDKSVTSTYVVSEGAAYFMQLPSEAGTHRRLFAIMESGVDATQLGMAFPQGSKTVQTFERADIDGLRALTRNIVKEVLSKNIAPRDDWEYLALDKTITISRDGGVQVETRHRIRFTKATSSVVVPHTIWRVSQHLPNVEEMIDAQRTPEYGILRSLALDCGHAGQRHCTQRIIPGRCNGPSHEHHFTIRTEGGEFKPSDELEYGIAWEYPGAFATAPTYPNSVGLRCGERGIVQHATLTIQFERPLDYPDRILEGPPDVYLTNRTEFQRGEDAVTFWHASPTWKTLAPLRPCPVRSGVRFEVYRWAHDAFHGMAKVTFAPHLNYFQSNVPAATSTGRYVASRSPTKPQRHV